MKKGNKILSLLLSCVIALGSFSFTGIKASANEAIVLFSETFESGYESTTDFDGKAGSWTVPAGVFGRNGTGEESEVNALRSKSGNLDFNFTEPYQDQMVLKVTADFVAGYVDADNYMRIDVVGLNTEHTANDDGRISLCHLVNGKVYVNCIGATDARDTGATYTAGTRYIMEGIIDQANETCTISIYEKATGTHILEDYNIDPYKHDKSNYYKLTHGFTGVRFATGRGNVSQAFDLHDIKVEEIVEEIDPWVVTEDDVTLLDAEGVAEDWNNVSVDLRTVEIDFGEAMEESTLTTSTVYIVNTETEEKVSYTPGYEANVYTLTLDEDEELDEETTYDIVIKKSVVSAAGGVNTTDTVFSFTTKTIELPEEDDEISGNVLFSETFESGYESTTSFNGKAGSWTVPAGVFGRNGTGEESEVNALRSKSGNLDFNFTEPYQDQMVLKVTADFLAGALDSGTYMRIDVVGLNTEHTANDDGRISLCHLVNGKVYVNCIGATDARDTGATYTAGTRYIMEGIIDQANETCTISIYEKATGTYILEDYNIDPYKHDKSNYYKLTHGFTGVRFATGRGNVSPAFDLHDIKVEEIVEEIDPWVVTEDDVTLLDAEGVAEDWNNVSVDLRTVEIDFGEAMEESTLTTSTVYIVNTETEEKVSYTPGYEANVYTLTLDEDEELDEETTYDIVIKKSVVSAAGGVNTTDTVFSFTTKTIELPEEDDEISGNVLFSETFESGFESTTNFNGKTGSWRTPDGVFGQEGTDEESRIYPNNGKNGNADFAFSEPYQDQMVLRLTAEISAGDISANDFMQIDVVGLNDVYTANDDGRITVCHLVNGKIYVNCIGATAARDTGATYTAGQRMMVEGIIDEANKTFKLSVYDKETGAAILKDYNVVPYKHDKQNYYALTHGFTGLRFRGSCASTADLAYTLYDVKVEKLLHAELTISESSITLIDGNGNVQAFDNASILTNKIEVDFGMPMNTNSLSANSVYILNTETNKKVSYTGSYNNNIYTMNLTAALETETEYEIVFEGSIKTEYGDEYGRTTVIPFTTVSAEDVLEADGGYNRTFEFDDLNEWSKAGITDTFVSNGKLSVPNTSTGERHVSYVFDQEYTEKMVLDVSYEISTGTNTASRIQLNGTSGYIVVANFNGGYIYVNTYSTENTTGVAYEPGKTYTVNARIDQHEGILSVTVLDEEGNKIVENFQDAPFGGNNGRGANIVGLSKVTLVNNIITVGEIAPLVDNLVVSEVLSAPKISSDKVSIGVMGGESAVNFNNVNPASNMVTLGVGTILNTETLNNDNIKILNGDEEVDTTIAYSNRTITIIINEVLSSNKQYTIFVSEDIENADGVKMESDFEVKFTTGASSTSAAIKGISVNDHLVDSMAQISNGDNLFINIDYMNSTGEDKTLYLIVAGYNGNSLVRANYIEEDVDKSITKSTIVVESGAFNTEGVDSIMVMIWDGFDTMHPLSPCVSIN